MTASIGGCGCRCTVGGGSVVGEGVRRYMSCKSRCPCWYTASSCSFHTISFLPHGTLPVLLHFLVHSNLYLLERLSLPPVNQPSSKMQYLPFTTILAALLSTSLARPLTRRAPSATNSTSGRPNPTYTKEQLNELKLAVSTVDRLSVLNSSAAQTITSNSTSASPRTRIPSLESARRPGRSGIRAELPGADGSGGPDEQ